MPTLKNTIKLFESFPAVNSGESLLDSTANHIRALILSGKLEAGTRLPGVRYFARIWPVSYVVIQKALEKCACEGLLIRHPGRGTFVADKSRAEKINGTVYLVIQQTEEEVTVQDYSVSEYFAGLAAGLQKEFAANGVIAMSIPVCGSEQERVFISRLRQQPADLVLLARSKNTGIIKEISSMGIPLLLIDPHVQPSGNCCIITHDETRAAEDIANFLMENGKDRVGILFRNDSKWVTSCRLDAIKTVFKTKLSMPCPEWIKTIPGSNPVLLEKAVAGILSTKRKPNALVVNAFSSHAVRAVIEKLKIPGSENITIVSYDMAPDSKTLSMSVIIDSYEYGRTIGRLVYNRFYKEKEASFPEKIMLPFSVAKP